VINFLLQAGVIVFSMFAAVFWLASATGRSVGFPWQPTRPVTPADRSTHQAYWNARAALCAGIAAVLQASAFLERYYFAIIMGQSQWPPWK
jgi:hypothetical protein